jgi:hypothetical protein
VLGNAHNKNTEKLPQDYLTFFPNLADFGNLDVSVLKAKFKDNIQPLITIASNNGFDFIPGKDAYCHPAIKGKAENLDRPEHLYVNRYEKENIFNSACCLYGFSLKSAKPVAKQVN